MQFVDSFTSKPKGQLSIVAVHLDGRREVLLDDRNLVVNNAKEMQARLLAGYPEYRITHLALGSGPSNLNPAPPELGETELIDERLRVEFDEYFFPYFNAVSFRRKLSNEEGNGLTFTEAGLIANNAPADKQLFAKRHFGGIPKTDTFHLEFTWTIVYV